MKLDALQFIKTLNTRNVNKLCFFPYKANLTIKFISIQLQVFEGLFAGTEVLIRKLLINLSNEHVSLYSIYMLVISSFIPTGN